MNPYEAVPGEIKVIPHWVCYNQDKHPINPRTGGRAMSNNPSTWAAFDEAAGAVSKWGCAGVGFMLGDGIFGIDLDHCYDPATGVLSDMAADIVEAVRSYTEFSPSGTGLHILCRGTLPAGARRRAGLEMYETGRYFTVTGKPFGAPLPLAEGTVAAAIVHKKYLHREKQGDMASVPPRPVPLSDREILDTAFRSRDGARLEALYNGAWQGYYGSQSEADLALCNALAFWFGADSARMDAVFRASGLMRPKWDERHGAQTYAQMTLSKAVADCREGYEPSPAQDAAMAAREISDFEHSIHRAGQPRAIPRKGARTYTMDDTGNARRFYDVCGTEIRYNHTDRVWYVWDGTRWAFDDTGAIKRMADKMLDDMEKDVFGMHDRDAISAYKAHIRRSKSSKGKEAFIREAQHLDGIPVLPGTFDRHKGLLNCPNGTVALKSGKLLPHSKEHYITRRAGVAYDPQARAPTWEKFLSDITAGDAELLDFLQCMVGYCLSGSIREQCIFFLYGNGANGKSTFLDTLRELLGDYAMNTQAETIMVRDKQTGGARGDLARLKGARIVTTAEPEADMTLNEGLIKQMTGGEAITARFLYGRDFEYKPEFKVLMATNHKPRIKGTDLGIWRRIKLIPFTLQIPPEKQDKALPEKLRAELPGILNWAIEGALRWQQNAKGCRSGLPQCRAIDVAVEDYKGEMDRLKQFLEECVYPARGQSVQASVFYHVYKKWCEDNGERYPLTGTKFGREMKKRFTAKTTMICTEYSDIGLTDAGMKYMSWASGAIAKEQRQNVAEQLRMMKS